MKDERMHGDVRSMVHLSLGNLPSQWAHTNQIANMAQALAQRVDQFTLVTGGDVAASMRGMDDAFRKWYNLHEDLHLVRLPVHFRQTMPFPKQYSSRWYPPLAILYTCMRSPDVVYTRTLSLAKRLLRTSLPVVWECHAPVDARDVDATFLQSDKLIGVISTAKMITDDFLEQGLAPEKALTLPNAVDLRDFLPYLDRETARATLGLTKERHIIVYSGHLYDYKGIPTVLEVASRMSDKLFLFVGGWPADVERLEQQCRGSNLNNVRFIGHVPKSELSTYLYAADALLLPTSRTWEEADVTNPLKLFDYMAVRRPIVASALPNIEQIVRGGEHVFLAKPDDPTSFEKGLTAIFSEPSRATSMTERAYQEVQRYTWDSRAEQVLAFTSARLAHTAKVFPTPLRNVLRYVSA